MTYHPTPHPSPTHMSSSDQAGPSQIPLSASEALEASTKTARQREKSRAIPLDEVVLDDDRIDRVGARSEAKGRETASAYDRTWRC